MDRYYLTPIYAVKRLNWALSYLRLKPENWKRVFWLGETPVERGQEARK
jgi:hypothetical protein